MVFESGLEILTWTLEVHFGNLQNIPNGLIFSVVAKFWVTKNGTEGARIKNSKTSLGRGHRPTVLLVFNNIALQLLFHCPICFRCPYVLASEPTFSGFNPFLGGREGGKGELRE